MRTLEQIIPEGMSLEEFLLRCRTDFKFWCERVIQTPENHEKGLIIKPFHLEWFRAFYKKERSCIIAPRGSGKTEILGVAFSLWIAFFNQFQEFLIISRTMEQSTKLLERIKLTIQENELLRKLVPKKFELAWSKTEINTSTRCKIFCKPYTEAVRGVHVDYVLLDEASTYLSLIHI